MGSLICPACGARMLREIAPERAGVIFRCPECGGRASGMSLVRREVAQEYVNRLWAQAIRRPATGRRCPACEKAMTTVGGSLGERIDLDVCTRCHFVFFDPGEAGRTPKAPPAPEPPAEEQIPEAAREAWARLRAEAIAERFDDGEATPDSWWQWAAGLLGLPIEDGFPVEMGASLGMLGAPITLRSQTLKRRPVITWVLTAAVVLVSVVAFFDLEGAVDALALMPAEALRYGGLTLVTAFFLHADVFHLIGNVWFLMIFGDNVEDHLGEGRFLLLILLATVAGGVLHAALDPRPEIPLIGASGGISGVIVYYALAFPRARLAIFIFFWWYFRWLRVPAWTYFGFWVLVQILGAVAQRKGVTHVSAFGHLGGAAVGVAFWGLWGRVGAPLTDSRARR